jgi:two-component system, NtrC family, response regulator AtoC
VDQHTTEQLTSRRDDQATFAYSLLVVASGVTSSYPLEPNARLLIGRAKHADVRIDHPSVSREHAALEVGSTVCIRDLGSANGTRVRGAMLDTETSLAVAPGDVIDLGEVLLVVHHRRLEQRFKRACPWPFFQLRAEEEWDRVRRREGHAAVAQLRVDSELGPDALQLLLASGLREGELVSSSRPGVLALCDQLRERGAVVAMQLCYAPSEGPEEKVGWLLGRRQTEGPRPRAVPSVAPFVVVAPAMLRVCELLQRVAPSTLSVILLGETGTGKEVCAELVHRASPRSDRKLLRLNCAALSEPLLESELFGHERGSFTGAHSDKLGLLESAQGGTVFLDEVGDMPLATQIKLLRVLEAKEVLRIGSRSPRPIDLRVISATNRDLQELITRGLFREDLYYRLNGISVLVPPLRERPEDIEPLARHFAERASKSAATPDFSGATLDYLRGRDWPGNVRELKNMVERASVLCDGPRIELAHLGEGAAPHRHPVAGKATPVEGLRAEVKALERERIEQALREARGNQRLAAELLGLSRGALLRRLGQLGIARTRQES